MERIKKPGLRKGGQAFIFVINFTYPVAVESVIREKEAERLNSYSFNS